MEETMRRNAINSERDSLSEGFYVGMTDVECYM
jgi:hypothetical protein